MAAFRFPCATAWWDRAEAVDRLRDPAVLDALFDVGVVAVDMSEAGPPPPPEALVALHRAACVTVAVNPVEPGEPFVGGFDVALFDGAADTSLVAPSGRVEEAVDALSARAADAPMAGRALMHVLRATETLPVLDALTVESLAYSSLLAGAEFRAWLATRPAPHSTASAEPPLVLAREGDRLDILFNRPAVRNAYNAQMRDALVDALRLAEMDPTIERVELRGAGPAFCSGGDLNEFGLATDVAFAHTVRMTHSAGAALHAVRERVAAVVHGPSVGAGVEIAAFACVVVADPDATFRLPEVSMGLIPGAGGTVSIPRRIGRQRAGLFALSGVEIDAPTAHRWGLVDSLSST